MTHCIPAVSRAVTLSTLGALLLLTATSPALAQSKARLAQEAADYLIERFGREAAKDGTEALARRIEAAAVAHGDEVFMAVRRAGPRGLQLIEEAGEHSRPVARLLAAHGEEGAVFVASRPSAMRLLLEHGDEAANVLVKTRGVAEPAVASLGEPAVRAFGALTTRQDARLLAMMAAEGGELEKIGRTPELLGVIEKYGPKAMHFIWDHKGALAVTAGLTAFLANPEPFLNGAKDLTKVVAEDAVKPLAEVPAIAAKEGAAEVARKTNWTLLFLVALVALILLVAAKWGLFPRRAAVLPAALRPRLPPAPARPPPEAGLAPETGEDFSRLNP